MRLGVVVHNWELWFFQHISEPYQGPAERWGQGEAGRLYSTALASQFNRESSLHWTKNFSITFLLSSSWSMLSHSTCNGKISYCHPELHQGFWLKMCHLRMGGSVYLGKRPICLECDWRCLYPTSLTQGNRKSPLHRRCVLTQTTAELLPAQDLRYLFNSDMIIFMARPREER